jgi:predicted dehydrogenase/threonine dehydrogenase-like Zn-dependent dehydrogenase
MKQVLQNMRDGKTTVADIPTPGVRPKAALVRTAASLVSAGTERMLVEFAGKSLVGKARSRPDLVRQVLDKARREGLLTTLEAAFNRLDQPMSLGYSSAGTIITVGEGLEGFQVGDRVACAGGGFAVHAEYAVVPEKLLALLPPQVDFESAAFTTLGAIALHGFRLAQPQLGEKVAVIGLGLLGLLSVSIARAAGCSVFGVDLDPARVALAQQFGAIAVLRSEADASGRAFTQGHGFDAVLICADTKSNDPVELAGVLARDRGHVISVGAVGNDLPRKIYFEKELHFQVSRSYGPGRYDLAYEEGGQDYPYGYVRWSEGRNLDAFVNLLASGEVDVKPLISHRFPIDRSPEAYDLITGKVKEPFLGVLLTYPENSTPPVRRVDLYSSNPTRQPLEEPGLGVLGAGNYATAVFLPNVVRAGGVTRVAVVSGSGFSAHHAAQKFKFNYAGSSEKDLMNDPQVNILAILTRHNHHARQVLAGLAAGKHIFCEKPLAIHPEEIEEISQILTSPQTPLLTVGFNRRFAPLAIQLKKFLENRGEALAVNYTINAGYLPLTHWTHDPIQGGGRIIGEGCHFIDFITFLVGEPPISVLARALPDAGRYSHDNVVLHFKFHDGSMGTVNYLANGDKSYPKERVEVFTNGRVAVLNDFRSLELVRDGKRQLIQNRLRQDKGHLAAWQAFLTAVRSGGKPPIPYEHLIGVTRAALVAMTALESGKEETL